MNLEEQSLDEIEQLLAQSLRGFHYLFDNGTIARILQKPTEELDFFSFDNMDRIQGLFTKLIGCKGIDEKRDFLRRLDAESFEILLRTYFHIVDSTILSSASFRH